MKTDELIKALGRLKVQTGSLVCLGCGYEHNCGVHGCAITREAAVRLSLYEHGLHRTYEPGGAALHRLRRDVLRVAMERRHAMYILSGDKKQIINSDFVERFCISEKPDAALIVASYDKNAKVVTVARYRDLREAQKVLGELLCAIAGGQAYYTMPESLLYAEQRISKDARIKRKGGS